MNEPETLPSAAARLAVRDYLQSLPEAPFAPELSQRLQARTRARLARSRRFAGTLRVALAAALALLLLMPGSRLSLVPPAAERLASESAPAPDANAVLAQVQALDRELQAAIQRGDSAARLAALWAERDAVVAQLSSSTPAQPARI
jgi:hypothetical protein